MQPESWQDLSAQFAQSLLMPGGDAPVGLIDERSRRRFQVYRNNVFASLTGSLQARYPAVFRLMGEGFFNAAAKLFIMEEPPKRAALSEYGVGFAGFLDRFEPAQAHPFLSGVARLEWAMHEASNAADSDPADVARLDLALLAQTRLSLSSALRVVSSPWPIVSIWRTNIQDPEVKTISADAGGECALILREDLKVTVQPLGLGTGAIIARLADGMRLDEASMDAEIADVESALGLLLRERAITDFTQEQEAQTC